MFAVKGWSVSADSLKPEAGGAPGDTPAKKSKKRKRASQPENVTSSNVADMWEKVIDHKEPKQNKSAKPEKSQPKETEKQSGKGKKRQKLSPDDAKPENQSSPKQPSTKKGGKQDQESADTDTKPSKKDKKDKDKKDKKKGKQDKQAPEETGDAPKTKDAATKAVAPAPAPPKLTPLQASMREKLISARFRHLNETLYTRPSAEAFNLFKESPEMFTEYHEGFRRQVDVWPQNPVEGFLAEVRGRARQRHPPKNRGGNGGAEQDAVQPLPRNRVTNVCTIADLGCGDARLASELQREKGKLKLDVLSFDLHSPSPLVTKADIANLPLANGTVDVAIFCLALMGTNWVDFVEEAYRVLRWKGELWVAEIKSRFGGGMRKGPGGVVEHSVGHRRNPAAAAPKLKKGAKKQAEAAANEAALLVEVDGEDDTRQQTDVSAFVDVLNKRGFMLQGQDQGRGADAVDLGNKMFVTMRFVKSAPAVKGKCAQKEEEKDRLSGRPAFLKKPKFIDDESKNVNEAAVLKPCVYKIR
ncbi:putative rRNA processing protein Rrp8 [Diaporthe sp. PMI_573]|nr:putative rRNA processing protein Rrp8 [Diaporthaceae sp. PMI_573]